MIINDNDVVKIEQALREHVKQMGSEARKYAKKAIRGNCKLSDKDFRETEDSRREILLPGLIGSVWAREFYKKTIDEMLHGKFSLSNIKNVNELLRLDTLLLAGEWYYNYLLDNEDGALLLRLPDILRIDSIMLDLFGKSSFVSFEYPEICKEVQHENNRKAGQDAKSKERWGIIENILIRNGDDIYKKKKTLHGAVLKIISIWEDRGEIVELGKTPGMTFVKEYLLKNGEITAGNYKVKMPKFLSELKFRNES